MPKTVFYEVSKQSTTKLTPGWDSGNSRVSHIETLAERKFGASRASRAPGGAERFRLFGARAPRGD